METTYEELVLKVNNKVGEITDRFFEDVEKAATDLGIEASPAALGQFRMRCVNRVYFRALEELPTKVEAT